MSALDRPTADELRRGEIAAAVKNGQITPQEAEAHLHALDGTAPIGVVSPAVLVKRRPALVRSALQYGADVSGILDAPGPCRAPRFRRAPLP
ncbi:MAG: hypothetical protein ACRYGP_13715 [Janthinobacterium lividum]